VFNALRSDELLVGVGRMLRMAAASEGPLEDFQRSQLLSAYSVTRLLAAEQRAQAELLEATRADLLAAAPEGAAGREAIASAVDGPALGAATALLLEGLAVDDPARVEVHRALRTMVDAEVAALDRGPEGA
jgi:hypothetical protein